MATMVEKAAQEYWARQNRWVCPSIFNEMRECCSRIRPTRKNLLRHYRTAKHVAVRYGVDPQVVRAVARLLWAEWELQALMRLLELEEAEASASA